MKKNKGLKTVILIIIIAVSGMVAFTCTENYSNGERIGTITQFSHAGRFFKSWEGHLNSTQTGMNSSIPFDFSIDNDNEPANLISKLDSAANQGWKVKLVYHLTKGKNWFHNRGNTDYFVTECIIIDRNFSHNTTAPIVTTNNINGNNVPNINNVPISGRTIDTIYVVIYRDKPVETACSTTTIK